MQVFRIKTSLDKLQSITRAAARQKDGTSHMGEQASMQRQKVLNAQDLFLQDNSASVHQPPVVQIDEYLTIGLIIYRHDCWSCSYALSSPAQLSTRAEAPLIATYLLS